MVSAGKYCLIVDDDEILRSRLRIAISARGYDVQTAANGDEALALAAESCPDMAVVDLKMPGLNGLELLTRLREQCANTRVVVLTGWGSIANAIAAMRAGAVNYLTKPVDATEILAAFESSQEIQLAPNETEWNHIQRVLNECSGNVSQAAKLLDIPRRTLQRKLKKRPLE